MGRTAVIYLGGDPGRQVVPLDLRGDLSIAADSGLGLAHRLGEEVDVVVGDLDSVDPVDLDRSVAAGSRVEAWPEDKDATDLELAVSCAIGAGVGRLVVLGGAGGRLDHLLANLAVLSAPNLADADLEVEAYIGTARTLVIRDTATFEGEPGSLVSLLAWHGDATGVTTAGLRYPLQDGVVGQGSARGTSNRFVDRWATVEVGAGVLTATQPDVTSLAAVGVLEGEGS